MDQPGITLRTDALLFEALRHRIATIADEGQSVLKQVSSSPVATEANDCNVAVMNSTGAAIAIGAGLSAHAIDCMMTTRRVIADYAENPGYRDGDMFLANDPYTCSAHQTCVALVAPVWRDGRVVAWVGSGIHLPDMGGPVAGQVNVDATSIYQEAAPMPPLRIVEERRVRKDIEAEFVARSRTPQQLSLDLRALIAACDRLIVRLNEMFERFSVPAVTDLMEDMIAFNRAHLAERIRALPEGRQWEASVWLDFPRGSEVELYECRLIVERRGDRLCLDLTRSSDQAGAVINCGEPGLLAGILNALMVLFGYGLPKCPEAMLRSVDIESRPGSFVHAVHPAGCAKATTSACHAILLAFNLALSRMFNDVPEFAQRVLAGSGGFLPVIDIDGVGRSGNRFGVPLIDLSLSAGYGAMPGRDGIDSAGPLHSPFAAIANVETHEARYPLLYLWRRQEIDSGGLGTYRGGRGTTVAWTPHGTSGGIGAVLHGHGMAVASTPGIAGGHPGSTNTFSIVRASGYHAGLREGKVHREAGDFDAAPERTSGLYMTRLEEDDVVIARNSGGGGWGDPLAREPLSVLADVRNGAVSPQWAREGYGVVIVDDDLDIKATFDLRHARRQERVATREGRPPEIEDPTTCRHAEEGATLLAQPRRLSELGAWILPFESGARFHAVEEVCSACGTLLNLRVVPRTSDAATGEAGG